MKKWILCVLSLLMALVPVLGQDKTPAPVPEGVQVTAGDGLVLKGDLYRPDGVPAEGLPALILFHELEQSRATYNKIVPDLLAAGYIVLNVDLRGHGETGGSNDWVAAQADTQVWLAWLREQAGVRDEAIATMGASVGSDVALMGCAQDPQCVTAVAISPVIRFTEFDLTGAVTTDLADRSALLIAGQTDTGSADTVRTLFAAAKGDISARIFKGGAHGTGFFGIKRDRTATLNVILAWLAQQMPPVKSPK